MRVLKTGKLPTQINICLLFLHVFMSAAMLTHGYPKLMRIVNREWRFSDPLRLGLEASLIMAKFAEFFCSVLIILGLTTRYAAIPLIATMLVAWRIAHVEDPFGSQEKSFMYLITYLTILFAGPGKYSFDHKLFGS